MNEEARKEYKKELIQSILAVSFYMTVSIGLVFLNRLVLTDKTEKAGALFVSWYQFIVAYVIIILITTFCPNVPLLNLFPKINYKWDIVVKVMPVSVVYLFMIGFNNKTLEYVTVSGYNVVRSLTILFNILFTYIVLNEKTSLKACLACGGVIIGFFLGVEGEIGLTWKGCLFGVLSSVCVALYSIFVKKAIGLLDNNEYLLIEYNTPIAIIFLTPFVFFNGEFEVFTHPRSLKFWGLQTFAGIVGFIINIAIFLNIKYTTPLTHNISGTVKACLQTVLALIIWPSSEKMTTYKFIGTVFVIGFSALYSYIRKAEMKKKIEDRFEEGQVEQLQIEETKVDDESPLLNQKINDSKIDDISDVDLEQESDK